ncbi:hypothetical protein BJX70DRAFT_405965 [Aspergillus crustosus]
MVGVPRSTGCRTCVKRRVKCDETRPTCQRCIKIGVECLGYHRPLQFHIIQRPDQPQQRRRQRKPPESQPHAKAQHGHGHTQPLSLLSPTADEIVAPSLVYETLTTQTKEVFHDWLLYHFPRVQSSFSFRVDVGWMDFLRGLAPSTCPPALLWAIRTLITFQMGTLQRNQQSIYCARHMYGRGIRHLRSLLQSPSALSDESLAACILLGGYELLDGNHDKSWVSHTRGIRHLMCARGALAHKSGMGRTLMICFRPFFVAESFVLREPCFLASSEWTSLTDDISDNDQQRDPSSVFGLVMDHIFNETAKCPGYHARAQAILMSETDPEICDTRNRLQKLQDRLPIAPSSSLASISSLHVQSMTELTLEGLHSALGLLDQLSILLESDSQHRLHQQQSWLHTGVHAAEPLILCNRRNPPTVSCDPTTMSSTTEPIGDWLDRFSLVMGITTVPGTVPKLLSATESVHLIDSA